MNNNNPPKSTFNIHKVHLITLQRVWRGWGEAAQKKSLNWFQSVRLLTSKSSGHIKYYNNNEFRSKMWFKKKQRVHKKQLHQLDPGRLTRTSIGSCKYYNSKALRRMTQFAHTGSLMLTKTSTGHSSYCNRISFRCVIGFDQQWFSMNHLMKT